MVIGFCGQLVLISQPVVSAYNPYSSVDPHCDEAQYKQSAVCNGKSNVDPISGKNGVILKAAAVIGYAAGAAAIIILTVAGIYYVTAAGDPGKIKGARDAILYTLVGLLIVVLAKAIITFVIKRI